MASISVVSLFGIFFFGTVITVLMTIMVVCIRIIKQRNQTASYDPQKHIKAQKAYHIITSLEQRLANIEVILDSQEHRRDSR